MAGKFPFLRRGLSIRQAVGNERNFRYFRGIPLMQTAHAATANPAQWVRPGSAEERIVRLAFNSAGPVHASLFAAHGIPQSWLIAAQDAGLLVRAGHGLYVLQEDIRRYIDAGGTFGGLPFGMSVGHTVSADAFARVSEGGAEPPASKVLAPEDAAAWLAGDFAKTAGRPLEIQELLSQGFGYPVILRALSLGRLVYGRDGFLAHPDFLAGAGAQEGSSPPPDPDGTDEPELPGAEPAIAPSPEPAVRRRRRAGAQAEKVRDFVRAAGHPVSAEEIARAGLPRHSVYNAVRAGLLTRQTCGLYVPAGLTAAGVAAPAPEGAGKAQPSADGNWEPAPNDDGDTHVSGPPAHPGDTAEGSMEDGTAGHADTASQAAAPPEADGPALGEDTLAAWGDAPGAVDVCAGLQEVLSGPAASAAVPATPGMHVADADQMPPLAAAGTAGAEEAGTAVPAQWDSRSAGDETADRGSAGTEDGPDDAAADVHLADVQAEAGAGADAAASGSPSIQDEGGRSSADAAPAAGRDAGGPRSRSDESAAGPSLAATSATSALTVERGAAVSGHRPPMIDEHTDRALEFCRRAGGSMSTQEFMAAGGPPALLFAIGRQALLIRAPDSRWKLSASAEGMIAKGGLDGRFGDGPLYAPPSGRASRGAGTAPLNGRASRPLPDDDLVASRLRDYVRSLGRHVARQEIAAKGFDARSLDRALEMGLIATVADGVYADPDAGATPLPENGVGRQDNGPEPCAGVPETEILEDGPAPRQDASDTAAPPDGLTAAGADRKAPPVSE